MNIKNLSLNDIKPYDNNPRENENAVENVMNSIREYGFKVPLVVDKNLVIVTGHTRYEASLRLGLEEVPCIIADDLTDEQIKAYRIADNKVAEYSDWDYDKLFVELKELEQQAYEIDLTGFDYLEFDKIMRDYAPVENFGEAQNGSQAFQNGESFGGNSGAVGGMQGTGNGGGANEETYTPIIQYNIIFNNVEEQRIWHEFIRDLKNEYPNAETISERLIKFIQERR